MRGVEPSNAIWHQSANTHHTHANSQFSFVALFEWRMKWSWERKRKKPKQLSAIKSQKISQMHAYVVLRMCIFRIEINLIFSSILFLFFIFAFSAQRSPNYCTRTFCARSQCMWPGNTIQSHSHNRIMPLHVLSIIYFPIASERFIYRGWWLNGCWTQNTICSNAHWTEFQLFFRFNGTSPFTFPRFSECSPYSCVHSSRTIVSDALLTCDRLCVRMFGVHCSLSSGQSPFLPLFSLGKRTKFKFRRIGHLFHHYENELPEDFSVRKRNAQLPSLCMSDRFRSGENWKELL